MPPSPACTSPVTRTGGAALGAVAPKSSTDIHRFDISGTAKPTYLGSGTVPGRLLNQYSLSEYDGSLRVATISPNDNGLYVLNSDTLAAEGHLGGLGKGQQIYAVRFLGSLAYVVTFRQTDPLYVIDLSDPSRARGCPARSNSPGIPTTCTMRVTAGSSASVRTRTHKAP